MKINPEDSVEVLLGKLLTQTLLTNIALMDALAALMHGRVEPQEIEMLKAHRARAVQTMEQQILGSQTPDWEMFQ